MVFNVSADAYMSFMGRYSEPLAARFADLAAVRRGQRVLDVGSGPGALTAELTEAGLDLYPVLVALMQWGDRYAVGPAGPLALLTHRDCGESVRLQLTCAAGHRLASAREVTPLPGPGARKIA